MTSLIKIELLQFYYLKCYGQTLEVWKDTATTFQHYSSYMFLQSQHCTPILSKNSLKASVKFR